MTKLSDTKQALLNKWLKGQQESHGVQGIPQRPQSSEIQLSLAQQRQLFLELLERDTAVNNLSVFIEFIGNLNVAALEQSANGIIARHDVLRTRFILRQGMPAPEILEEAVFTIPIVDLENLELADPSREARRLAEKEVLQPFELSEAPLIRLKLYKLRKDRHILLVAAHHTIADGWSLGVLLQELMRFYEAITRHKPPDLPELAIQYADYAYWQINLEDSDELRTSMSYWKKQLGGELPILELPTDYQRGSKQSFSGGTHRFVLSKELTEKLEILSRQEDVTLFMTLLSVFYILLYRYCGQEEIVIGTPVANRNHPDLAPLIGVFINTLVLRIGLSANTSFYKLLKNVRQICTEAYSNQDIPFEQLVKVLKPKRDLSRTPLFQVVFNMQNAPLPNLEFPGLQTNFLQLDRGVSQFDLTLMVSKLDGQCFATVEYNDDLFWASTIHRIFQSYRLLLKGVLSQPASPISKLPLVPPAEMNRLVYELNQTQDDFPRNYCMHQIFEKQAEQSPDSVAIIYDHRQLTYLELNQLTNALARYLKDLGIGPGDRVGVLMTRSIETIQALLAVHKAGGTYVPLHTSYPSERIRFIIEDAHIKILLTNIDPGRQVEEEVQVVNMDNTSFLSEFDNSNPLIRVRPGHLAYIIYTSGSTGEPKGVMVNHSSLMNFLWSMKEKPGISKEDVLMAVTSISFDIAALELFLPLIVGATVVMASEEMITNPLLIGKAMDRHDVSIIQATPATWQILFETGWKGKPDLKALCGGDVLTRKLADQLLDCVSSLWNMYGPTETTIWSSVNQIKKDDSLITIGRPINNTQLYILDRNLQALPPGIIGELHIGGAGLAKGYLNQLELTYEKFIPDHITSEPGTRLYKTGDSARYVDDGSIEILGRLDDQLKINGHRIELGEITTVLLKHPAIADAYVLAGTRAKGAKRIAAYYVCSGRHSPNADELRTFIKIKLPPYMVPAFFIPLDSFPLTPNGKIDRKALPVPGEANLPAGYVKPENETEQILVEIWQNVLNIEQVGIHDNFFDLGGGSLQSLQIVAKATMYGFPLTLENIFEYQTIYELSDLLKIESG